MKVYHLKKGEIVQRPEELHSKVFLVQTGLLRSYIIDEKGREHTFMFAPESWIIGDNCSPVTPTTLFIDALEPTTVCIRDKDLTKENNPEKFIKRLHVLQQRVLMLLSSSALTRYQHFIETYPDIVQRVPQKLIASYLGITPEALSVVKKQYQGRTR